ncbi:MAG: hypothetical protein SWX82_32755 [Cyanobacteriota bacterium]|nr:hypothetical protein [Cyanobacteriota bacterium]
MKQNFSTTRAIAKETTPFHESQKSKVKGQKLRFYRLKTLTLQ